MKAPRHGHAACSFMGKYIMVTGSRKDLDFSSRKTELYDTENIYNNSTITGILEKLLTKSCASFKMALLTPVQHFVGT